MNDHRQRTENFSDDSIRRFLLGQLQPGEQTIFEERLFTDDALEARVWLAEFELADDYAFKRLTEGETESFRGTYLLTVDRNHKLKVSQALRDRLRSKSIAESKPAWYQRLITLFDLRRPTWRYAFAGFILMLILAAVVLVTKEPQIANEIIHGRFRPRPQGTATPESMHHSATPPSPAHVEQSPPAAAHESPLIVSLISTGSIDQSPVITLPAGEKAVVRFHLSIEKGHAGVYRADLLATSGETLFRAESLKPYGATPSSIDFDVPANILKSGQYEIRLFRSDDQARQESSQYFFRVQ